MQALLLEKRQKQQQAAAEAAAQAAAAGGHEEGKGGEFGEGIGSAGGSGKGGKVVVKRGELLTGFFVGLWAAVFRDDDGTRKAIYSFTFPAKSLTLNHSNLHKHAPF
jgi:hypothetical protein